MKPHARVLCGPTSAYLQLLMLFSASIAGCTPPTLSLQSTLSNAATPATTAIAAPAQDASSKTRSDEQPKVLFDSFHAHNFLDRGLLPGEHTYHHYTGLRRAVAMLSDRQVDVSELIVGPITAERLKDVKLIVLNLPSMDRPPWLMSEIEVVERYIRAGGGMIFITDHSNCYYHQYHLLPLWQRLGLIPTFETTCERTKKNLLSRHGPAWFVVHDFDKHPVTEGVRYYGMQSGGRVVGEGIIARTSPEAWADAGASPLYGEGNVGLSGDLRYSESEATGAQGVILAKSIDRGRVVVLCDQNALGDAQISYADNWRLWLNACKWAGQLKIDTNPLTIDKMAKLQVDRQSAQAERDQQTATPFDQLVGVEPDRNANPTLRAGSWQIECWEDISGGNFHWGGTDDEQFYYFWCWLNRWCWASAHEQPSNPAPSGRVMLMINDSHVHLAAVKQRVAAVLRQNGKVVLLASAAKPAADGEKKNAELTDKESNKELDASEWLREHLGKLLGNEQSGPLVSSVVWQNQPVTYAQFAVDGGSMLVIPDTNLLQNANFTPPERAPTSVQAKWQRQLYHWLFEQP